MLTHNKGRLQELYTNIKSILSSHTDSKSPQIQIVSNYQSVAKFSLLYDLQRSGEAQKMSRLDSGSGGRNFPLDSISETTHTQKPCKSSHGVRATPPDPRWSKEPVGSQELGTHHLVTALQRGHSNCCLMKNHSKSKQLETAEPNLIVMKMSLFPLLSARQILTAVFD